MQLIDGRGMWAKMRKSLGEKRRYLTDEQIAEITRLQGAMKDKQFGYRTIVVDLPLRAHWRISRWRSAGNCASASPRTVK